MGEKIVVEIDAALVQKMRAKAVSDGLPNADSIPDEELLAALMQAALAEGVEPREEAEEPTEVEESESIEETEEKVKATEEAEEKVGTAEEPVDLEGPGPVEEAEEKAEIETPERVEEAEELLERAPLPDIVWVRAENGYNLRVEPLSEDVIRILADQEKLIVLDREEDWLKVRATDERTGWISVEFVTPKDPYSHVPPKVNVRGIHGAAGAVAPPRQLWDVWIGELKGMGMAWYKQLDARDPNDIGPDSTFAWARKLKRNGIEPIVRFHQGQMFPSRLHDMAFEKMKRYAATGIVWCEIGNEPNLDRFEWHSNHHGKLNWQDPFYPRTIVRNWIQDAEKTLAAGMRPGFYALAPTDWAEHRPHPQFSSVMFYRRMFEEVASNPDLLVRFRRLFEPGKAWLAVHVSLYEKPPDFDPFPLNEPPYDMCLRGYEVPLRYLRELLDITDVVVISTEGGVFTKDSTSMSGHLRLGSHQEHAQRTVEMFDWLQENSSLQAMCPWLICNVYESIGHSDPAWAHDGWYDGRPPDFRPKPVVQVMKDRKPT